MPNIKSVVKDVKKSRENHLRNIGAKSQIKTLVKKTKSAIDAGADTVGALLKETSSNVDRAAKRGIIHKNAAARRKSRLAKKANKVGEAE